MQSSHILAVTSVTLVLYYDSERQSARLISCNAMLNSNGQYCIIVPMRLKKKTFINPTVEKFELLDLSESLESGREQASSECHSDTFISSSLV